MPISALKFYCAFALGDPRRRSLRLAILLLLACVLVLSSLQALAQGSGFAVLDPVLNKYQSFQFIWYAKIRVVAERLFWLLVLVDFSWSGVMYVLDKNTIEEIAISNVKKILTIGFFYSLLKFSDTWIPAIIHSFAKIGIDAGGVVNVTPDGIAKTGYELALACFGAVKKLGMLDAIAVVLPVTIIALVTLLAFLFAAAQLLVTLVESYLAIGCGVILLGFGGSRWTTDFAAKYLQYAVGTGVKLMILYLVVGVGQTIAADLTIDPEHLLQSCLQVLCIAAVHATGEVLGHGMEMAAGGIGDAVAGGGKSFGEKVAASTGGRIATQIEARRGGAMQEGASGSATGNHPMASNDANATNAASVKPDVAEAQTVRPGSAAETTGDAAPAQTAQAPRSAHSASVGAPTPAAQSAQSSPAMGDASHAELGPAPQSRDSAAPTLDSGGGARRDPLHQRIRDL